MSSAHVLTVLAVATVVLIAVGALRRIGIPAPVTLVVAGLIIGFCPFVPDVSLNSHLVLLGLLPLLVYEAAVTSSPSAFRREARSIGALAVLLVVATAAGVAAVAHLLGGLSWPMAFVLGTAVGPTDAAAATSIARRLGLPRRVVTLLEGEALFNDATALVLYAAAVGAATSGRFSPAHTAAAVVYSVIVGGAIGVAAGLVGRWLTAKIDDPPIEIAGSIVLAYAAYLPAEAVHASGVLAAVTAGLYLGRHSSGPSVSASTRLQSASFWQTLVFGVNAFLFVMVGLSFHTFTGHAHGSLARLVLTGSVVVMTVIVIRLVWMSAFGGLTRLRGKRGRADPHSRRERLVLGWAGMRGAITLAALLAVPRLADDGTSLAGRDDTIYLGFAVILVTLLTQGLTLPALAKRLQLHEHPKIADAQHRAHLALARAALDHVAQARDLGAYSQTTVSELQSRYAGRLRRLEAATTEAADAPDPAAARHSDLQLRRGIIAAQRAELTTLRRTRVVGATTARALEHELDLEDSRLSVAWSPHRLHLAGTGPSLRHG